MINNIITVCYNKLLNNALEVTMTGHEIATLLRVELGILVEPGAVVLSLISSH